MEEEREREKRERLFSAHLFVALVQIARVHEASDVLHVSAVAAADSPPRIHRRSATSSRRARGIIYTGHFDAPARFNLPAPWYSIVIDYAQLTGGPEMCVSAGRGGDRLNLRRRRRSLSSSCRGGSFFPPQKLDTILMELSSCRNDVSRARSIDRARPSSPAIEHYRYSR